VGPDLINIQVGDNGRLIDQLRSPGDGPPRISIGWGLNIVDRSLSDALAALPRPDGGPVPFLARNVFEDLRRKVREDLRTHLKLLEDRRNAIGSLIAAQDPEELREAAEELFAGVRTAVDGLTGTLGPAANTVDRLRALLGQDPGIALPFATVFKALQQAGRNAAAIPERVEQALLAYFFTPRGYATLDGQRVVAPLQVGDLEDALLDTVKAGDLANVPERAAALAAQLEPRRLLSTPTAERYIRDTIRVVVESAYDAGRGMDGAGGRYRAVVSDLLAGAVHPEKPAAQVEKHFLGWFRGFAAMGESAAMRAVEIGTQGVSQFQTNPLIAAAAGSFAGSVARKLAQDSLLTVLRAELGAGPVPD
jgi:hypothetical protein